MRPVHARAALCPLLIVVGASASAAEPSTGELLALIGTQRAQLAEQSQRIAALERALGISAAGLKSDQGSDQPPSAPAATSPAPYGPDAPLLRLGGYVQLDALYFPGARPGEPEDAFVPRLIASGSEDRASRARLSARNSRLWLEVRPRGGRIPVRAYAELDFFGEVPFNAQAATNSYEPRLRRAYAEIGPGPGAWSLRMGQDWSAFADPSAWGGYYNALPLGAVFARQPQVRFTRWFGDDSLFLSLENPQSEVLGAAGGAANEQRDPAPDVVLGWRAERGGGHLQAALMGRALKEDGADATLGWGVSVSGAAALGADHRHHVSFHLAGGEGVGRYVGELGAGFDGWVRADGSLAGGAAAAGAVHYRRDWSPRWRSSLGVSAVETQRRPSAPPDAMRASRSIIANTVFTPDGALDLALEYVWAVKTDEAGREAQAQLYRFATRLAF